MPVVTYMAAPIAYFITFKIGNPVRTPSWLGTFTTAWQSSSIATLGIELVIHVTMKVGRTVEPRTNPKEHAAHKPFRAVIAIR